MFKGDLTRIFSELKQPVNLSRWPIKNLIGQKFTRLLPLGFLGIRQHTATWLCRCDCGNFIIANGSSLLRSHTKSCGCYIKTRSQRHKHPMLRHGMTKTDVYRIWYSMKQRCTNPDTESYANYGAVGVAYASEWDDFTIFYRDVGPRPSKDHSLDRINTFGNYEPENVRWATLDVQAGNRRNTRLLTVAGETHHIAEWGRIRGINGRLIRKRIKRGWTPEEALGFKERSDLTRVYANPIIRADSVPVKDAPDKVTV